MFDAVRENQMRSDADARRGEVKNSSDRSRVDPIRLGRDRLPVLSLDAADDDGRRINAADPSAALRAVVDWRRIETALSLTAVEQAVFVAAWKKGIPRYRLAREIGTTPRQAAAVYDAVLKKLRSVPTARKCLALEPVQNSRAPVYRDRLQSGRQCYSLAALDGTFIEIMAAEKYIRLISDGDTAKTAKAGDVQARRLGRFATFMGIEDLKKSLAGEQSKLTRLVERRDKAATMLRTAENDFDALESAGAAERVKATLDEVPWSERDFDKRIAGTRAMIVAADRELVACRGAVEAQSAVVEATEGEILAGRHQLLARELKPLKGKLFEAMKAFCAVSLELRAVAHRHDFYDGVVVRRELFPSDDAATRFPSGDSIGATAQAELINASLAISDYLDRRYDSR